MKKILPFLILFGYGLSLASTEMAASYDGKYMFIRDTAPNYPVNSKCVRIGPKTIKKLSTFESCYPYKGENPPLLETVAKCDKKNKIFAYIFNSKKDCDEAENELSDGDAT